MKTAVKNWFEKYSDTHTLCASEIIQDLEYDKLNIIEIKEVNNDVSEVKHEFINEDGSSEKYVITLEKMNDEWRVAGKPYIGNGWF